MKYLAYAIFSILGLAFLYMDSMFSIMLLACIVVIYIDTKKAKGGGNHKTAFVVFSLLLLVIGGPQIFRLAKYGVSLLEPDSETFISECKTTGAEFLRSPASPVKSIAYDWDGPIAPSIAQFEVKYGTRIMSSRSDAFPEPEAVEFVERKRSSSLEGRPLQGPNGPYIRLPKTGNYYGISSLTADVLVHYRIEPEDELKKARKNRGPVRYAVIVTDRRTGEKLASLRYVVDEKLWRGCGLTGENTMSVRFFVLKALGLT